MATKKQCGPCGETGQTSEGVRFCTDCEENLCKDCVDHHKKLKVLKSHHLIELSKVSLFPSRIERNCSKHEDIPMEFYCTQHDLTCCRLCMAENHRSCQTVLPLQDAAKDVKNSSLLTDSLEELGEIENIVEKLLKNRDENLDQIRKAESAILQQTKKIKENFINHVELLVQKTNSEFSVIKMKHDQKINKEKTELADIAAIVASGKQELINLRDHGSNNQLFLALHQQIEPTQKTGDRLQKLISGIQEIGIDFHEEKDLRPMSLGSLSENLKPCNIKYPSKLLQKAQVQPDRIKSLTDFKHDDDVGLQSGIKYNITGLAVTTDNTLLLCNFQHNNSAVFVYRDCSIYDTWLICQMPYDVAVIPGTEKALVTLPYHDYLQVSNTKEVSKLQRITVGSGYYGISATEDNIVVGGKRNIKILNLNFVQVKEIKITNMVTIYSLAYRKNTSDVVCVCGYNDEVLCVNFGGTIVFKYKVQGGGQGGLTVDRDDNVYLCGYNTNNIQRLSHDGTLRDVILREDNGIIKPYAITFCNDFKKLYVINALTSVKTYSCK